MWKYKWEKRELVNVVLYLLKTGCQWRNLPHDFPPVFTVHSFCRRAERHWHGKKTKGRKHHIVTDTLGCLLSVAVHRANKNDMVMGLWPAFFATYAYLTIKRFCADKGYHSRRLSKDYELSTSSAEAFIKISHFHTLLKRLWTPVLRIAELQPHSPTDYITKHESKFFWTL